ncbi:MAG: hypothetical protein KJO07_13865 [Deltaproteobacteria bacterium]|nr:hypothetical protein [Deltaproteobacteria bacterium]
MHEPLVLVTTLAGSLKWLGRHRVVPVRKSKNSLTGSSVRVDSHVRAHHQPHFMQLDLARALRSAAFRFSARRGGVSSDLAQLREPKNTVLDMSMGELRELKDLSDRQLLGGLEAAVGRSRRADAEVIRFIAEVDRRQLYREQACSSMFNYCVERLGMSEGAAYRRIRVARLSRQFPEVLDALAGGRVHLVGLQLLAPHMTRANVDGVLARASGKSKREIEVLIRELAPKPDVPTTISRVRAKQAAQVSRPSASRELFPETVEPAKPVKVQPLAPERYHVSFTASEALKNKVERAKELSGHGARV